MDHEPGTAADHRAELVENLRQSVFNTPAATDPATRSAAATGGALPEPFAAYTAKVRDEAHRTADADVERLKAVGHSEDEIFEVTVAAAVGAALRRLDAGLRAIRRDG